MSKPDYPLGTFTNIKMALLVIAFVWLFWGGLGIVLNLVLIACDWAIRSVWLGMTHASVTAGVVALAVVLGYAVHRRPRKESA